VPIYEYLCERCGKIHEVIQKLNDKAPARCDECGSGKLAKLVSRSAFQLKGGGWYSDLYASRKPASGPEPAASGEKPAAPDKGAKKDGPAASKPPPEAKPAAPAAAPTSAAKGKGKGGD
jgi:putative FmdB family regulatory protein